MATLDQIKKTISEMSEEELRALVADMRKRRTTAPSHKKKKAAKKEKSTRTLNIHALLEGMTEEERKAFIANLKKESEGE